MKKRGYSALWRVDGQRRTIHHRSGVAWARVGEFRARSGDDAKRMARDWIKSSKDPDIVGACWTLKFKAKRIRAEDADGTELA